MKLENLQLGKKRTCTERKKTTSIVPTKMFDPSKKILRIFDDMIIFEKTILLKVLFWA